ncbi:MAG: HEAT repeat domain-containing protein [Planctomycetia bacterium]
MSYHVLDCTDCRTVLKIRDLTNPIPLHCPRCGEGLDLKNATVPAPRQRPPRKQQAAKVLTSEAESGQSSGAANRPARYASRGQHSSVGAVTSIAIVIGIVSLVGAGLYFAVRFVGSTATPGVSQSFLMAEARQAQENEAPGEGRRGGGPSSVSAALSPAGTLMRRGVSPGHPGLPQERPPVGAIPAVGSEPGGAGIGGPSGLNVPQAPGFPGRPGFAGPANQFPGPPSQGVPGAAAPPFVPGGLGQNPNRGGFPGGPRFGPGVNAGPGPGSVPAAGSSGVLGVGAAVNGPGPQSSVEELLTYIRSTNGSPAAGFALDQLSQRQIDPEKQTEVRQLLKGLMNSPEVFVRKGATDGFCQWAAAEDVEELRKILASQDTLLLFAKKKAIASMARFNAPELYPDLIKAVSDPPLLLDASKALVSLGAAVEQAVLEAYPQVEGPLPKNILLNVLRDVGTGKSLPLLEKIASSPDFSVRGSAEQALQAIRSRE